MRLKEPKKLRAADRKRVREKLKKLQPIERKWKQHYLT